MVQFIKIMMIIILLKYWKKILKLCWCLILYGHVKDSIWSIWQDVFCVKGGTSIVDDVVYNDNLLSLVTNVFGTLCSLLTTWGSGKESFQSSEQPFCAQLDTSNVFGDEIRLNDAMTALCLSATEVFRINSKLVLIILQPLKWIILFSPFITSLINVLRVRKLVSKMKWSRALT